MMKLLFLLCVISSSVSLAEPVILCDVSKGLDLINRQTYLPSQIEMILNACDKVSPNDSRVLLLHGLLARKNKEYLTAIVWLEKAYAVDPENIAIALELATTYELANQTLSAEQVYQTILLKNPQNRVALLGQARLFRAEKQWNKALSTYQTLLTQNAQDVDALNGLGWIKANQNELAEAALYFNKTLAIQPQNIESLEALNKIKQTQLQLAGPTQLCEALKGLQLLNQENPPLVSIKEMLDNCALNQIENKDTYLLHGLLARKEALLNKQFEAAIAWLQKAAQAATPQDASINLELAVTYEWANHPKHALAMYQQILSHEPSNKNALLGLARTLRAEKKWEAARATYQRLLTTHPKDVDALNGLGWVALAQNNHKLAIEWFKGSLIIDPTNKESLLGLKDSEKASMQPQVTSPPPILCDADAGLVLLNQTNPPLKKIQAILVRCDKNTPNTVSALLLHGLLARHLGKSSQNYTMAIAWLTKAAKVAQPGNDMPIIELAVTYEWANNYKEALRLYRHLVAVNPKNKIARLGEARVLRFSYQINLSLAIYKQLLEKYPNDIDALSGLGETYMTNYELAKAREAFNKIMVLNPRHKQTAADLDSLSQSTNNMLDLSLGHYNVPPNTADGLNAYYFKNVNATDGLTVLGTHNNRQIASGFGVGSSLLPNNSVLLGYQHVIPKQYGWQVSYDARQHNALAFENRLFGTTNFYLKKNLEWFGGMRWAFPSIWNTQLLISGLNLYTSLPVNIRVTGFWAFQQIGGYNSSYALDFSKEYSSHLFYDIGPSYLVEQKSFEVHGKLIFPTSKNQALVIQASHYFFNNSTFINAGWRVYWAQ